MMRQASTPFLMAAASTAKASFSFQCDPALTDKNDPKNDIEVHSRNRFRNPGSKEYNRSNEK